MYVTTPQLGFLGVAPGVELVGPVSDYKPSAFVKLNSRYIDWIMPILHIEDSGGGFGPSTGMLVAGVTYLSLGLVGLYFMFRK